MATREVSEKKSGSAWPTQLVCNGRLNPLIRDRDELRVLAEQDGTGYPEACRLAAIHLHYCYGLKDIPCEAPKNIVVCNEIAKLYFQHVRTPYWRRAKEILPSIRTPAQFLAKHGNTDCLSKCSDAEDLAECCRLMGSYNEFNTEKFNRCLSRFNVARYLNENNPNNGSDLFQYKYGWEGSHVVYIGLSHYYPAKYLSEDWKTWHLLTLEDFVKRCRGLAAQTNADEFFVTEETITYSQCRLWWD